MSVFGKSSPSAHLVFACIALTDAFRRFVSGFDIGNAVNVIAVAARGGVDIVPNYASHLADP